MKILITCSILITQSFFLLANTTSVEAVGRCLEEQLTASAWAATPDQHWEFLADGSLYLFDQVTQLVERGEWRLEPVGEKLNLKVIVGAATRNYNITARCDQKQIVLQEYANGDVVLIPMHCDPQQLESLAGDWQKGFSGEEPFLAFKADGTYVITDVTNNSYELRTGRWSLLGNTLLLHSVDGELQAYLIKHLQLDELVLSPFNTERQDWFLNKL